MSWEIRQGHVLDLLRVIPDSAVHVVCTSPPYWGLRSYSTTPQVWGGDTGCEHAWDTVHPAGYRSSDTHPGPLQNAGNTDRGNRVSGLCPGCGAWRGELGSEPTPELYVSHLTEIFREVRRVLRADGVCLLNIGDSYFTRSAMRQGGNREQIKAMAAEHAAMGRTRYSSGHPTLKDKDLCLIPERLAISLQDDGWYIRSRIAWCKRATMPESVRDRPTTAWEHIWLLSKSAHYFYDIDAVREPHTTPGAESNSGQWERNVENTKHGDDPLLRTRPGSRPAGYFGHPNGRNLRNYWLLSPEAFPESHFAVFPTEIPRRAILAGSSAHGCCAQCGAPWRRVTQPSDAYNATLREGRTEANWYPRSDTLAPRANGNKHGKPNHGVMAEYETTGWEPTCSCRCPDVVPATILDLFSGAGTTCLVADRLGRHGIGLELNPEYVAMSERRIRDEAPLFSFTDSEDGVAE